MIYPAIQEPKPSVEIKSVNIGTANCHANFAFQFRRNALIGINYELPFVLPRDVFQRPIFFSWQFPIPYELGDSGSSCLSDRLSAVCAVRIDNYDVLRE